MRARARAATDRRAHVAYGAAPFERARDRVVRRRFVRQRTFRRRKAHSSSDADDDASTCSTASAPYAFEGVERLYGTEKYERLARAHVVVVGLGGVGSWAAEALARTGVGALTLIDLDSVCETNVNRQVEATFGTIGKFKTDAMAARVMDINPRCDVKIVRDFVQATNCEEIFERGAGAEVAAGNELGTDWRRPDYVLDAIDKEGDKAAITAYCVYSRIPVCVTGGAGGVDALRDVRAEDLVDATFNRLLSAMRKTLRKKYSFPREVGSGSGGTFPGKEKTGKRKGRWGVTSVYTAENENEFKTAGTRGRGGIGCEGVGGSAVFVTGAIGFKAASEIVLNLVKTDKSTHEGPATTGWRSRVWACQGVHNYAGHSQNPDASTSLNTGAENSKGGSADRKEVRDADRRDGGNDDENTDDRNRELRPSSTNMAEALALSASEIFDAHCHWHLGGEHSVVRSLCSRLAGAGMMTTRPSDWDAALAIRSGNDNLTINVPIAYGVHPWWAYLEKNGKDAWMEDLRRALESTPNSVVGEIGLDKVAVPPDAEPDYDNQLDCFKRQLALATDLRRPVVVHSVKATRDMTDAFRLASELPPRIFMHSFGGSEDFLKQLIKMKKFGDRFYFGFSSVINLRSPKTRSVIEAVPDERLLLESDLCDPTHAEDELRIMLAIIADIKGWTVKEAARRTRENAARFFATEP